VPGRVAGLSRAMRCALMLRATAVLVPGGYACPRCVYCLRAVIAKEPPFGNRGHAAATVDHVVPRELGGATEPSNLVIACSQCNRRKWTRPLESFLAEPGCRPGVIARIAGQLAEPPDIASGRTMARELYPRPRKRQTLTGADRESSVHADREARC
jgi:hypothetical protein